MAEENTGIITPEPTKEQEPEKQIEVPPELSEANGEEETAYREQIPEETIEDELVEEPEEIIEEAVDEADEADEEIEETVVKKPRKKRVTRQGVVYILQNPAFDDNLIKVGRTANLTERLKQLNSHSGVPMPFEVYYARKVSDAHDIESKIHRGMESRRLNPRREFFEKDPEEVKFLLEMVPGSEVTVKDDVKSSSAVEKRIKRRKMLKLEDLGIPAGAVLKFVPNEEITGTVTNDTREIVIGGNIPDKFKYMEGKEYNISKAAMILTERDKHVWGAKFWLCGGRKLIDIRDELL